MLVNVRCWFAPLRDMHLGILMVTLSRAQSAFQRILRSWGMSYDEFLVRRVICLDYALITLLAWVLQVSHHVFVCLLEVVALFLSVDASIPLEASSSCNTPQKAYVKKSIEVWNILERGGNWIKPVVGLKKVCIFLTNVWNAKSKEGRVLSLRCF